MNHEAPDESKEFQKSHSIWDLGNLLQFLQLGSSRSEVENLLGKPQGSPPYGGGALYDILDLRVLIEVENEKPDTGPVYLQVEYEGDKDRWEAYLASGDQESSSQTELSTDKLLTFAILPILE